MIHNGILLYNEGVDLKYVLFIEDIIVNLRMFVKLKIDEIAFVFLWEIVILTKKVFGLKLPR